MNIANKTVVIFGPGEHFGFHLAKKFATEGFHIALVARSEARLEELRKRLAENGVSATTIVADVRVPAALADCVLQMKELPPLDCAIFNVKANVRGDGLSVSPVELTNVLDANVSGAMAVVQACVPLLQPGGVVLLTGGGYKDRPDPEKLALSVSKGALHTLFLAMQNPLRARGLSIKTVVIDGIVREAGPIKSNTVAQAFWDLYKQETNEPLYIS